MNLSDKFYLFKNDKLICNTISNLDELKELDVKLKNLTKNVIFEKNISFDSVILPTGKMVFIGAYSYMNADGYIRGPAFMGRFCSIGRRVSIGAGKHSTVGLSTHPHFSVDSITDVYSDDEINELCIVNDRNKENELVFIGSDVWIGDGAVILPGITIGNGAIIGANAVVTKDVAPYSIVGGVPAKNLKKRFPNHIIEKLNNSAWWDIKFEILKNSNYKNIFKYLLANDNEKNFVIYNNFNLNFPSLKNN